MYVINSMYIFNKNINKGLLNFLELIANLNLIIL